MNTLVDVRVTRAYGNFRVGHVFRPNGVLRDWLVRRGLVEIVGSKDGATPIQTDATTPAPAVANRKSKPRR